MIAAPQGRRDASIWPDLILRFDGVRGLVHSRLHLAQMEAALGAFDLQRCLGARCAVQTESELGARAQLRHLFDIERLDLQPGRVRCSVAAWLRERRNGDRCKQRRQHAQDHLAQGCHDLSRKKTANRSTEACGDTSNATRWFNVR